MARRRKPKEVSWTRRQKVIAEECEEKQKTWLGLSVEDRLVVVTEQRNSLLKSIFALSLDSIYESEKEMEEDQGSDSVGGMISEVEESLKMVRKFSADLRCLKRKIVRGGPAMKALRSLCAYAKNLKADAQQSEGVEIV